MSWMRRLTKRAAEPSDVEELDPALKQALGDFKASIYAWSDAASNRPRSAHAIVVQRTWRLAAGWSLAVVLLCGTISGGLYEHHQRKVEEQLTAERQAEHQRQLAAQRAQQEAQQEEDMLASVDNAVSREVPSAMEPLAQLTDESESR
jgi:hypothetical protein